MTAQSRPAQSGPGARRHNRGPIGARCNPATHIMAQRRFSLERGLTTVSRKTRRPAWYSVLSSGGIGERWPPTLLNLATHSRCGTLVESLRNCVETSETLTLRPTALENPETVREPTRAWWNPSRLHKLSQGYQKFSARFRGAVN